MRKRWNKLWKGFVLFTVVLVVLAGGAGCFWGRAQNHIVHSQALRGGQGLLYGSGYGLPF